MYNSCMSMFTHEKTLMILGYFLIPLCLLSSVCFFNETVNLTVILNMPGFWLTARLLCLAAYLVFCIEIRLIDPSLIRHAGWTGALTFACMSIPYGTNQVLDTLHVVFAYAALACVHVLAIRSFRYHETLKTLIQIAFLTSAAICFVSGGVTSLAEATYGIILSITLTNAATKKKDH